MLTIDEEKARGKELSTLYPTAKSARELAPRIEHAKKTNWGAIAKQGVFLGTVIAIAFVLITIFLRVAFDSTGALQRGSILFIVFFLLAALIVISGAKAVHTQLSLIAIYGSGIFWSGLVAAFGSSFSLYALLLNSGRPELTEFWITLAVVAIGIVIATTAVMLIVGKLLDKSKPSY